MKNFALLVTTIFASLAVADVQTFTDPNCYIDRELVGSKHGNCYNLDRNVGSMKGCSVGHRLRVWSGPNCYGATNVKAPQKCVNLGTDNIGSFKCMTNQL
jgi:hypothetical protein